MPRKAIIIGATSGIGRTLGVQLAEKGYYVGFTGRRTQLLEEIRDRMNGHEIEIQTMDITKFREARKKLASMVEKMGGLDLLIINSGIGGSNLSWDREMEIIDVNAKGFVALARWGLDFFKMQGHGHIVGISSVAGTRGNRFSTVYSSTKAFISNYMHGIRHYVAKKKLAITVTDIRPGFVETPMTDGREGMFWVSKVDDACKQMVKSIERRSKIAYVSRKYRYLAWVVKWLPDWIYFKL